MLNCLIYCQGFILTPIVFLTSCMDPIFQLVLFSVVNDIWKVMIPCVCILYSNANIKIMHESWGSVPLLFRTLSYQLIFDIFNWYLISILCVYGRQTFSLGALCHHEKCRECLVYLVLPCSLMGVLLSHFLFYVYPPLGIFSPS